MFLSALATLNFSLAFLVGLFSVPLTFIRPVPRHHHHHQPSSLLLLSNILIILLLSPPTVLYIFSRYFLYHHDSSSSSSSASSAATALRHLLAQAAFGWHVWRMWWSHVVVWCVWWPAWFIGQMLLGVSWFGEEAKGGNKGVREVEHYTR